MRDFKNMKRQRGRNRSGGGSGGGGNGGGKPQQNANRAFDSNGPENVKIRGHAQHVFEKYQQLARDAFSSGDRVVAENYLQHADHYFRLLRALQPQRSASEILGRDSLVSGLDIDFEEEFEVPEEGVEASEATLEVNGGADTQQRQDGRYDRSEGRQQNGYETRDGRQDRFEPRREGGEGQYREQGQYRDHGQYRDQGQYRDRQDTRDRPENRDRAEYRDRQDRDRQPPVSRGADSRTEAREGQDGRDRQERDRQERDRQERGEVRTDRFEARRDNRRPEGRREDRPSTARGASPGRTVSRSVARRTPARRSIRYP